MEKGCHGFGVLLDFEAPVVTSLLSFGQSQEGINLVRTLRDLSMYESKKAIQEYRQALQT